jgi:outer membrane immunogenic protein
MERLLLRVCVLLSFAAMIAPAGADEYGPKKSHPAKSAPARTAPTQTAKTAQATNWSGGQIGGNGGGSVSANNFAEPMGVLCPPGTSGTTCYETPFSFSSHPVNINGGLFAGYRVQFGNMVVGVEADANLKQARSSVTSYDVACANGPCSITRPEQFTGSVKQGADGSVRARVGMLVTPNTLLFVTGGLLVGQISGSFYYDAFLVGSTGGVVAAGSWTDTRVGGTVGAGAEIEWLPGVKLRAEYRYGDYGTYSKTVGVTTTGACAGCTVPLSQATISLHESFQRITVGVAFDLP